MGDEMDSYRLGVGCPMWANRDWVGRYLPADTPAGEELAAYSSVCNAVEGNTTFYAVPSLAAVERWVEQTPDRFRFAFKVPRPITHNRRLRDAGPELDPFIRRLDPLAGRLGPVCIQLPASFGPESLPVLRDFLAGLTVDLRWSVEVRHLRFHAGGDAERELNDLLHENGANRVMLDTRALFDGPRETSEEIETTDRKPNLPVRAVATSTEPVVRFIGQTDEESNPPYWEPWIDRVVRWLDKGLSPLVFLHTPDNAVSPSLARRFHAAVRTRLPDLAELPEPLPVAASPSLFDD